MLNNNKNIFVPFSTDTYYKMYYIKISGPDAHSIINRFIKKSLTISSKFFNTVLVNPFSGNVIDSCSVIISPKKSSFTGEEMVEIHFSSFEKNQEFNNILISNNYAYMDDVNELLLRRKMNKVNNDMHTKSSWLQNFSHKPNDSQLISHISNCDIEYKYIMWNKKISHLKKRLQAASSQCPGFEDIPLDSIYQYIEFIKKEILNHVKKISKLNKLYDLKVNSERKIHNHLIKGTASIKALEKIKSSKVSYKKTTVTPSNDNLLKLKFT